MKEYNFKFKDWKEQDDTLNVSAESQVKRVDECIKINTEVKSIRKKDSFVILLPTDTQIKELEKLEAGDDEL